MKVGAKTKPFAPKEAPAKSATEPVRVAEEMPTIEIEVQKVEEDDEDTAAGE